MANNKREGRILFLSVILLWALFLYLMRYAIPWGDDFAHTVRSHDAGGLTAYAVKRYQVWTGRWAMSFSAAWLFSGPDIYAFYAHKLLLLSAFSCAGWICLVKAVWGRQMSWIRAIASGLLLYLIFLSSSPELGQTFYWLTGALNYPTGIALAMMAACCIRFISSSESCPVKIIALIAACVLGAIVPAVNELTGMYLILLLAAVLFGSLLHQYRSRNYLLLLLAIVILSFLVVVMAPGNEVRTPSVALDQRLAAAYPVAMDSLVDLVADWIFDPRLIIGILYLFSWLPRLTTPAWLANLRRPLPAIMAAVWLAGLLLGVLIPVVSLAGPLPDRVLVLPYAWFVCGILLFAILGYGKWRGDAFIEVAPSVSPYLLLLLMLGMFITGNGREVLESLTSGAARQQYQSEMERVSYMRSVSSAGASDVVIWENPQIIEHLLVMEITTDPAYRENRVTAQFFGLESVAVDDVDKESILGRQRK